MEIINARLYGIIPNEDITENLIKLTEYLSSNDGEKKVIFDEGVYYIDSKKCKKYMLYITNTVGDKEFKKDEIPHQNAVAFYFSNMSNVTFDGGNSVFVINGKVTNIALESCKNITLRNIEIRHSHPDMHEYRVLSKKVFSVDFKLDDDTLYEVKNGKMFFYGNDYKTPADRDCVYGQWIGQISKETPNKIKRVRHPLHKALKVCDLGENRVRVTYPVTSRFKDGERYYFYDVRRQYAGIFVNKCENICFENIKQRFNYSLALVAQDSENITVDSVEFAPENGSSRMMSSIADFMQICMCRGDVVVKNSYFDGAGDDCLNVHGIHFKIVDIDGEKLVVRFMHPQSHGFNPLRVGDTVAYINSNTMLEEGSAVIEKSHQLNEYDIELVVNSTKGATMGEVIEDISSCPNFVFENNTMTRIITRGILVTTRGKVSIINNHFISTTMSGILLSDDAKNWYESGMCKDVTIEGNTFEYCGETPILIKPENKIYSGPVHENIKIINNTFNNYSGYCINAKSTNNIIVEGNNFLNDKKIKTVNCKNVNVK